MRNIIFFSIALIIFSSCSSVKFTADYDGDVDFEQHKTLSYYGWQEESDKILTKFEKESIEKAFGDEFRKRGFTLAERDGDIIVSLFIVVDQKKGATASLIIMVEEVLMAITADTAMVLAGAGGWDIQALLIRNMTTM